MSAIATIGNPEMVIIGPILDNLLAWLWRNFVILYKYPL